MPVVSGNRAIFSGSVPATQAAVTWHNAAAQPLVIKSPLALHQLADARPDGLHQFVEMDVLLGGLDHGLPHFGQNQRTADDGIGPLAVDQRAHAEAFIGWIR